MIEVLKGVRVVEQGTFITGPACGMLLGDLGADVIKVEQPGTGDPFRAFKGGLYSPHFQTYNRNKRSITLNTKHAGRPRASRRAGRDGRRVHPELPPRRGRASWASASAAARAQPAADLLLDQRLRPRPAPRPARPSYDTVAQAASGFLKLLVNPANPRVVGPGHRRCA